MAFVKPGVEQHPVPGSSGTLDAGNIRQLFKVGSVTVAVGLDDPHRAE